MDAGRVACCPLVSHAVRSIKVRKKDGTDRHVYRRTPDRYNNTYSATDMASIINII